MLPPWYYFAIGIQVACLAIATVHFAIDRKSVPWVIDRHGMRCSAYAEFAWRMLIVTVLCVVMQIFVSVWEWIA